jgi:CBS domain-containing protein
MKIKHLMTKDPKCCMPSDTAQRAAIIMRDEKASVVPVIENEQSRTELMRDNQIRRIPVIDEQRRLVGIVSLADVVERASVKTVETHETLKTVSAPTGEPSKPRAKSRKVA